MDNPNPGDINLTDLPPEILLIILKILLTIDPITLLGSVPGVCKRLRALCSGVHGSFDMGASHESVSTKAMTAKVRLFPWTTGLWTFSRFPLIDSCNAGLLDVTDALLKEDASKVDNAMDGGYTPLYMACKFGHLEVARLLVENGADINRAMDGGYTYLFTACSKGHLDVARLLVENGADVNKADHDGWTPLFTSCGKGHLDIVRLLVEKGADMDMAANDGCTPLEISLRVRCTKIIYFLEQAGANE